MNSKQKFVNFISSLQAGEILFFQKQLWGVTRKRKIGSQWSGSGTEVCFQTKALSKPWTEDPINKIRFLGEKKKVTFEEAGESFSPRMTFPGSYLWTFSFREGSSTKDAKTGFGCGIIKVPRNISPYVARILWAYETVGIEEDWEVVVSMYLTIEQLCEEVPKLPVMKALEMARGAVDDQDWVRAMLACIYSRDDAVVSDYVSAHGFNPKTGELIYNNR